MSAEFLQVPSMPFVRVCFCIALQAAPLLAAPTKVLDEGAGLYLGGEEDAKPAALKEWAGGGEEIRVVDLLGQSLEIIDKDENGIRKMKYAVKDWAEHLMPTTLFIKDGIQLGMPVLVHCKVGCKGGGSVVVGYMMQTKDMSFQAAYDKVREVRPCVDQIFKPENKMFLDGLMKLEATIMEAKNNKKKTEEL